MAEGSKPKIVLIGSLLGVTGLVLAQLYTISNLRAVQSKLSAVEAEQAKAKESVAEEMDKVRAAASDNATERQKALASVQDQVEQARKQASGIAGQVRQETQKSVQELSTRIAADEN